MRATSCTTLSKSKYKSKLIIVRQKNTQNILEIMCVWDRDSHAYTKKYIKYLRYKPAKINKSWEQNTQNTQNRHTTPFSPHNIFIFSGYKIPKKYFYAYFKKMLWGTKYPKILISFFLLPNKISLKIKDS